MISKLVCPVLTLSLLFLLLAVNYTVLIAAENDSTQKWVRLVDKNFSVAFPADYLVDAERIDAGFSVLPPRGDSPNIFTGTGFPRFIRVDRQPEIMASLDNVRFNLEVKLPYEVGDARTYLWHFMPRHHIKDYQIQTFEVDGFKGRLYLYQKKALSAMLFIADKDKVYIVTANTQNSESAVFNKFMQSVTINGKPLLTQNSADNIESTESVLIPSLKTSTEVEAALKHKRRKFKSNLIFKPEPEPKPIDPDKIEEKDKSKIVYSRPLLILRQPRRFPYFPNGGSFSGKIRLRVSFLATGDVGDVTVLSDAPKDLAKTLFKETLEIKFLPAQIDGKNVDSSRTIEHNFDVK